MNDDVEAPRFQSRIKKEKLTRKLLILLDPRRSQENMESRQNHFWYVLIAPPFPPLSPPIQYLPYSRSPTYQLSQSTARPSGDTMTVVTVDLVAAVRVAAARAGDEGGGEGRNNQPMCDGRSLILPPSFLSIPLIFIIVGESPTKYMWFPVLMMVGPLLFAGFACFPV